MKLYKFFPLFSAFFGMFLAASVFAQGGTFSDPNVAYTFDLPQDTWKMTAKPSATNPNVEYVNVERKEGHLEIRKLAMAKDSTLADLIRSEEQKLQFLPGYIAGKEETFGGHLRGTVFNFEFVRAGANMSGRFYFLKAGETTVYLLRFTGLQNKLRSARNQTDSIARTFEVKKAS
jgi:hypothetical protein